MMQLLFDFLADSERRMNSMELTSVLEVAVFGLAIVQALTILLTVRRERDLKELREIVHEQRLRLAQIRAWLASQNASQKRIASERENNLEPIAEIEAPKPGISQRDLEWQREVAARQQSGIKAHIPPTGQAKMPASTQHFKWFRDDSNSLRDEARGVDSLSSEPNLDEVEKTLKAIRLLKED